MYLSISLWPPSQFKMKSSTMFHLITSSRKEKKYKKIVGYRFFKATEIVSSQS